MNPHNMNLISYQTCFCYPHQVSHKKTTSFLSIDLFYRDQLVPSMIRDASMSFLKGLFRHFLSPVFHDVFDMLDLKVSQGHSKAEKLTK